MSLRVLLLVGFGSFAGGILRFLISSFFSHQQLHRFPWSTLIVNVVGCFCIGLLYAYAVRSGMSKEWSLFFGTGLLGGFTTFSAFSNETVTLVQQGHIVMASTYVLSSVILGITATVTGYIIGRMG